MIKKPGVLSRTRFTTANLVLEVERGFYNVQDRWRSSHVCFRQIELLK